MNINDFECKEIITELQSQLGLQHVTVIYDSKQTVELRLLSGQHTIYLNVIDSEAEKDRYMNKSKEAQKMHQTKSPAIHFPDLTVFELIDMFQSDITGAYDRICEYLKTIQIQSECQIELLFVMNIFLHEVGHWNKLYSMDRYVKKYIDTDYELAEANDKAKHRLHNRVKTIRDEYLTGYRREKLKLPDKLIEKLMKNEEEYRKIPKEADADAYAKEILEDMDMKKFLGVLGVE